MPSTDVINLTLSTGVVIPLRSTLSKTGNVFWGLLNRKNDGTRYFSRWGVNLPASDLGGSLPTFVEMGSTKLVLTQDTNSKEKPVAKGSMKVKVYGEEKILDVRFTAVDDNTYNINASVHGSRGNATASMGVTDL